MKHIKLFEEFIEEGVNDPAIFKVIFIIGGPGSGKSYVSENLGLEAMGYVNINSDIAFEYLMNKNNLNPKMPPEETERREVVRKRAKEMTGVKSTLAITGRLGVVIDGTGDNYAKINNLKNQFEELGYDNFLVVVNTRLDIAKERNRKRKRSVPDSVVVNSWNDVQNNIGKFMQIFENVAIIDNNGDEKSTDSQIQSTYKKIMKFTQEKPSKPAAKQWVKDQSGE